MAIDDYFRTTQHHPPGARLRRGDKDWLIIEPIRCSLDEQCFL